MASTPYILIIGCCFALALKYLSVDVRNYYLQFRETQHKRYVHSLCSCCSNPLTCFYRQVRRKYGIPDSDNDVFNVAYAKAQKKREEATHNAKEKAKPQMPTASYERPPASQPVASGSEFRRRAAPPGACKFLQ